MVSKRKLDGDNVNSLMANDKMTISRERKRGWKGKVIETEFRYNLFTSQNVLSSQ